MSEVASRPSQHRPALRVLLSIAAIATLCIIKFDINLGVRDTIGIERGETEDFYHNQQQQRRNTLSFEPRVLDILHSDWNYQGDESEEDYNAAVALANNEEEVTVIPSLPPLPKYTIKDALEEASVWEWTFCILVYEWMRRQFGSGPSAYWFTTHPRTSSLFTTRNNTRGGVAWANCKDHSIVLHTC